MYQTISEKVAVAGIYNFGVFTPKKMQWNSRIYPIEQITLITETKDGGVASRIYSVVSKGNVYRLHFNRSTEIWILQEVWYEG